MPGFHGLPKAHRSLRRHGLRRFACQALGAFSLLGVSAGGGIAQSGTPPDTSASPPGGFVLPQGGPPTGLQAPLPPPTKKPPAPDKPATTSPDLRTLLGHPLSHPLTIQEAVALTLYTNRSLALAGEVLLQAQGHTSEARAAFNPTLGSTFSFTQFNQNSTVNFNGNTIVVNQAEQKQIGMQATLPIDISGLLRAAVDQAKFQEVAARLDVNRTRNQIVLDVKTAFYNALRAQALLDVAQESLQNSLARQADSQKRLNAGVVAPYDVQRAATDVANAQLQVLNAQNQVSQSLYALKNTMGLDVNTPIAITDQGAVETPPGVMEPGNAPLMPPDNSKEIQPPPLTTPTRPQSVTVTDPLPPLPDYSALLHDALQIRPEILEADANLAAAKKGIALAQRSVLPSLGVTVSGSYTPDAGALGGQTTSAQGVVTLNIPIFDGGVARARVTEARASVSQAVTNRRTTVDSVIMELQSVYQSLIIARDSLAVSNQSLALAREAFRLARVRYTAGVTATAGVSPLLEVSDAQNALTQAESNQVNALYNYNNARSQLDKAVGRYAFVFNGGKEPAYTGFPAPPPPKTVGNPTTGVTK